MRVLWMGILMLLVAALCVGTSVIAQTDLGAVTKVKDYYADWLSSIPGITSVGVGAGASGIPEIELHADVVTEQIRQLPHELNGFPVRIIKNTRYPDDAPLPDDALAADHEDKGSSAPMAEDSAAAPAVPAGSATMIPPGLR